MSIGRQVDKKALAHIHSAITQLLKRMHLISSNEVDESGVYYTKWSKSEEKHQYNILTHIYGIYKDGNGDPIFETAKQTQM